MRKDNEKLFNTGRLRKKAIWSRIAQEFNGKVDDVFVTGDQCQSKWKKLEQKYKDVKFHNSQSGNDRKEREFYDLMDDVIGNNPKVVPVCTMSSMENLQDETDASGAMYGVIDDEDENENPQDDEGSKKKKKRKSRCTSAAVVEFLNEYNTEYKANEKERLDVLKRMHDDKMEVMNRFLTIMERQHHG